MPRIDIWDVEAAKKQPAVDCGFPRDLEQHFEWGTALGKGGFGLVRVVIERSSGIQYACKSVSKILDIPNLSAQKQAQHLDNIKREIKILTRLRGTLSVVDFKGAYEDDESIHMVMELCRGGELVHEIGRRPYTEKTVAGYMRSVLHTLAQCHSHRILHRDIKPGNFMLLTSEDDSPLKAIDFGLAVFYDPDQLPRTDLGLEGTPWFMAPETLSSQTYPASDVWAAGVMAYQLLSGYLPFDDPRNPHAPALSAVWKAILTEQPSFRRSAWKEVSQEARDFVTVLLDKDHSRRPSAKEALRHPWLSPAFHQARTRPISATVVQRIQRFAQSNLLRRTILELIAQELLKMVPALSPTVHGPGEHGGYLAAAQQGQTQTQATPSDGSEVGSTPRASVDAAGADTQFSMSPDSQGGGGGSFAAMVGSPGLGSPGFGGRSSSVNIADVSRSRQRQSMDSSGGGSGHGGEAFRGLLGRVASQGRLAGSMHGGRHFARSPSSQQLALLARGSERQRGSASVHGPGEYWRVMRQASELAAMESGHGRADYLRAAPRSDEERSAQRKAARLSLDTSAHGGDDYRRLLQQLESIDHRHKASSPFRHSKSSGSLPLAAERQQQQQQQQQTQQQQTQQQQQQQGSGLPGWPAPAPALGSLTSSPVIAAAGGASQAAAVGGGGGEGATGAILAADVAAAAPAEERGRGRGAAKALLERLSAEPGANSGSDAAPGAVGLPTVQQHDPWAAAAAGAGLVPPQGVGATTGLPPLFPASPAVGTGLGPSGTASSSAVAVADAGAAAPRSSKRVSFGGEQALGSPRHKHHHQQPPPAQQQQPGQQVEQQSEQQQAQQQGADAAPMDSEQQQRQQQQQTLVSWSAAAAQAAAAAQNGASSGGGAGDGGAGAGASGVGVGAVTDPRDLEQLMRRMQFRSNKGLGPGEMSEGLRRLGYDLEPSEVATLMRQLDVDADGQVQAPEFVASQLDWAALQESHRDLWLECARRAFAGLDANADGRLSVEALISGLKDKLPAAEVDYAVEDALVEAGYADADEVDFEGFLRVLRVGSYDSLDALDQYDSRYGGSLHSRRSMELEGSQHWGQLDTVPEETPRAGGQDVSGSGGFGGGAF